MIAWIRSRPLAARLGAALAAAVLPVILVSLFVHAANNPTYQPCSFDITGAGGPQAPCTVMVDTKGNAFVNKATFRIATGPVTSFATAATDWLVLTGSASKTVRVTNITLCGTATAAATNDVLFVKRSTADTGGTTGTAPTIVPLQGETASAAIAIYTANPTLGTAVGNVDGSKLNLGAAGAAGCASYDFGTRSTEAVVLSGTAQQLAINWNGASLPAGASVDARIEWTEE
jgi:hypothetical protein